MSILGFVFFLKLPRAAAYQEVENHLSPGLACAQQGSESSENERNCTYVHTSGQGVPELKDGSPQPKGQC